MYSKEEGEDDVKSAWPLCPGLHTRYNGRYRWLLRSDPEPIPKKRRKFGLQAETACMKSELLVTAGQLYCGEYVLGPCTHRPSRRGSRRCLKSTGYLASCRMAVAEGRADDCDEVVTRQPYGNVWLNHLLSRESRGDMP